MNPALAIKVEKALGLEEGYFLILQAFHDIEQEKLRQRLSRGKPNLSKLRRGLFWDTDINQINWVHQRRAVIERILERGNEGDKAEIRRFYGDAEVDEIVRSMELRHA